MKTKIALILLATVTFSNAVIVQYTTTFAQGVVSSTGTIIPDSSGYTAVGFFSIADSEIPTASAATLASSFIVWGTPSQFGFGGFAGIYENVADGGRIGASNQFRGNSIYILNTNASTIATSTEALVFKTSTLFTQDDSLANPANPIVELGAAAATGYILGGAAGPSVELTPGTTVPTVAMAALIPEPSSALLGALGAFGLLRRRRN